MPFEPGEHDAKLWIPQDARAQIEKERAATVVIDNRTELPDEVLEAFLVENTALFGFGQETRYLSYAGQGTMMARSKWLPPRNVFEEMAIARDLVERDDDVAEAVGTIMGAAYAGEYDNQHDDEQVERAFGEMSEDIDLLAMMHELHRELLISSQITTVTLFTRASYDIRPENVTRVINRSMAVPRVTVLPAERIRVVGDDLFGQGPLAYLPDGHLAMWLREFFSDGVSAAKKRELRMDNPVAAALFTGKVPPNFYEPMTLSFGSDLYFLNPSMAQRSTMAKGTWRYPRPLLTRNLPLLEAKRLLNVMDHALLQGGINYIVVAKKGDEKKPATQPEIANLQALIQRASRSGVLIGDHRISLDIIQPDMQEMLNPDKRRMIGRKLSQALLRVPEFGSDETGAAVQTFTELAQAVITDDRNLIVGHIHRHIWTECMKRNADVFGRSDRPLIWMPKIILQGLDFWSQYLLKLYDRGDLPRKYMVEFGGYRYSSVMAQKSREVVGGHDEIFAPPPVPYSAPGQGNKPGADPNNPYRFGNPNAPASPGPQDNGPGRPRGSRNRNGAAPDVVRPSRLVRRTRGETIRAFWSDEEEQVVRIGEITERIIGEYPDAALGRVTPAERAALDAETVTNEGNVIVVPVNTDCEIEDVQAVRLDENFSMLTGHRRPDGAIMAAAFCFREPRFTVHEAEDMVVRWGYPVAIVQDEEAEVEPPPASE